MPHPDEQTPSDVQTASASKKIIVLSDTHIGTSGSLYKLFEQSFLKKAALCDHIVLNGDIFDFGYFSKKVENRLLRKLKDRMGEADSEQQVSTGAIPREYVDECLGRLENFINYIKENGKPGAKIHFVIGNSELVQEFYDGLDRLAGDYPGIFEWDRHSIMLGKEKKTLIAHGDEEVRQINELAKEASDTIKSRRKARKQEAGEQPDGNESTSGHSTLHNLAMIPSHVIQRARGIGHELEEALGAVRDTLEESGPETPSRIRDDDKVNTLQQLDEHRPGRKKREIRNILAVSVSGIVQRARGISDELVRNIERNVRDGRFSCTQDGVRVDPVNFEIVDHLIYGHTHVATKDHTVGKVHVHNPGSPTMQAVLANGGPTVLIAYMGEDGSLSGIHKELLVPHRNKAPILAEPSSFQEITHNTLWENGGQRDLPHSRPSADGPPDKRR